jgi:LysR family transcriptional regulator, hydrogen peroxide-inducible genes activator
MNIHQFQYILALAETRHFENAAEKCCITQSTLSTMISKFEDEVGIMIFDRKKKPVDITSEGMIIIEQLKKIHKEIEQLTEISKEIKGEVSGDLTISVIPTIAPGILPLFITDFASKFPNLIIEVKEETTAEIMRQIKSRDLDIGIVSIPLNDKDLREIHLYDEPFVFFDTNSFNANKVDAANLDVSNICLLDEGHCMRAQILELCNMQTNRLNNQINFKYNAGSIDSLMRFVKANKASTLLPFLSSTDLPETDACHIHPFEDPMPFRSIGLVVHRHFVKNMVLEMLKKEILLKVTPLIENTQLEGKMLMPI